MREQRICICKNKDADQLRGNREADQRFCFRCMDSTLPLLLLCKISSFYAASVTVLTGLYRTWSETTLLVFPRGGSNDLIFIQSKGYMPAERVWNIRDAEHDPDCRHEHGQAGAMAGY